MMSKEREKAMESEVQENRDHGHAFEDEEPFCHFCMLREALADRDELKARVVALVKLLCLCEPRGDEFYKRHREKVHRRDTTECGNCTWVKEQSQVVHRTLDDTIGACKPHGASSRICERGTQCCTTRHFDALARATANTRKPS